MAEAKVIVSLPSLEQAINALGKNVLETGVSGAGTAVAGKIVEQWSKGETGEGGTLQDPPISKGYKKEKESSNRRGFIDFNWTGDLQRSFGVKSSKYNTATLSFTANELQKARGLMERRPQGLEVGDKLSKIASTVFNKWLRSVVKFQK